MRAHDVDARGGDGGDARGRGDAHALVARLARRLAAHESVVADAEPTVRRAAVLATFRVAADGDLELLFIKRAEWEGDPWSGHVAFPGGRQEPDDATLEDTAVRETREELGVDVRLHGRILGTLDELHPRNPVLPPIVVRPYVAVLDTDVVLAPSEEVALAFWVPLGALLHPSTSTEATVVVRGVERTVASYRFGDHTIWGMTERVLRQLLGLLDAGSE